MLQATITVQFGINCTATSSNSGLIALLRVVIITHYNACYVIMRKSSRIDKISYDLFVIKAVGHKPVISQALVGYHCY